MNLPTILASHDAFLQLLQLEEHMLDEKRNPSLAHCSDEEFLDFFATGILKENRTVMRELSSYEARRIIDRFANVGKTTKMLRQSLSATVLTFGIHASELIGLNSGSFRRSRQGDLVVDVIGKGGNERTLPIMRETEDLLFHYRNTCGKTTDLQPYSADPLLYALYNKTNI